MKELIHDVMYDNVSDEDLTFLSLKYCKCNYVVEDTSMGLFINYETPREWPALFVMKANGKRYVGIFTSKLNINLAFIKYNKEN
jgi:hypothetical protein